MTPAQRPAVVTGASSGIGEATARALAELGHPVVLGARRLERCEKVAAEIAEAGGRAVGLALDLADEGSVAAFATAAEQAFGPVEVLVSNAGAQQPATAMEATSAQLLEHLQVNALGTLLLAQVLGRGMVARGRGDLVFVTSEVVRAPRPGVAPYVASKFAVEGLVASLQRELEGTGVRVSCIRPGQTMTEMGWDWDPAVTDELLRSWAKWGLARHPHFLPPSGVAAAVTAVVGAPPGVCFAFVDVEPVPPARKGEQT
ncbi:MAG: SDR family oxidoreductase [Mycobacteriales bacterium]